jgi:hypothetical protein
MCAAKIRWVKAPFERYPWDSAKERGHKSYAFVNTQKADFWAVCIVKSPWAQEAPLHILSRRGGKRSDLRFLATGSDFVNVFLRRHTKSPWIWFL